MSLSASFVIPSILMGLGIAIDVAIATLARYRDASMGFRNWTRPVAIAHIALPAIGYYSWWYLGQAFAGFRMVLGLVAFFLIAIFIYESFCDWIAREPITPLGKLTESAFEHLGPATAGRFITIMAVSMDALWSGPAKAAQAESGGWTNMEVLVSFVIAGAVVAIVAQLSLAVARALNKIQFTDLDKLSLYLVAGKYAETSILSAFGILSLWNAFYLWFGLGSLYLSVLVSFFLFAIIWAIYFKPLLGTQRQELIE